MTALIVADFDEDDDAPRRGKSLVDAARAAGASWVAFDADADCNGLLATARAARDAGVGLLVRVGDTKSLPLLEDALADLGERSVPALRDRLLVVVATERAGKRLRTEAPWAPSAVDLGAFTGFLSFLRRAAPNYVRAACLVDDVVLPHDLLPPARIAAVAVKLRSRGGRLWLSGVGRDAAASLAGGPAHGLLVRSARG